MNQLKNVIIIVLLLVVAGLVFALLPKENNEENGNDDAFANVTDFASCIEAGGALLETFPEQCRTPDGRSFTDEVVSNSEVVIDSPAFGATVTSPLTVTGKARGNWFFEANIPVTLKDGNGKVLAQVGAQAQGEWMTTDFVNFSTVLNFAEPETEMGVLVIEKDNPSGLPENAGKYEIPVSFK